MELLESLEYKIDKNKKTAHIAKMKIGNIPTKKDRESEKYKKKQELKDILNTAKEFKQTFKVDYIIDEYLLVAQKEYERQQLSKYGERSEAKTLAESGTYKKKERLLLRMKKEYGNYRITDISKKTIDIFLTNIAKEVNSQTFRDYTHHYRKFFIFCKKNDYIEDNIFPDDITDYTTSYNARKKHEIINYEDLKKCFDYCATHHRDIHLGLAYLMYTGARPEELLKACIHEDNIGVHVDIYNNYIVSDLNRKNKSPRKIILNDILKKIILENLDEIKLRNGFIYPFHTSINFQANNDQFTKKLKKICRYINIPEFTPKDIRIRMNNYLQSKGWSDEERTLLLGHTILVNRTNYTEYKSDKVIDLS